MTTKEIKDLLADKLRYEGTYFRKSDISVKATKNGWRIVIKDYEHIPFIVTLDEDDYLGKCVYIREQDANPFEGDDYIFEYDAHEYPLRTSLLQLGYYIGTHF